METDSDVTDYHNFRIIEQHYVPESSMVLVYWLLCSKSVNCNCKSFNVSMIIHLCSSSSLLCAVQQPDLICYISLPVNCSHYSISHSLAKYYANIFIADAQTTGQRIETGENCSRSAFWQFPANFHQPHAPTLSLQFNYRKFCNCIMVLSQLQSHHGKDPINITPPRLVKKLGAVLSIS